MRLTAIISPNFRDVATGAPKVLLRQVMEGTTEYRDHCWVEINKYLDEVLQGLKRKNKSVKIAFEAEIKEYEYRGSIYKRTLTNITSVSVIKKK